MEEAMEDAIVALRIQRQLKPAEDNNFGLYTSGTILNLWETATSGIFAVLVGVVALSRSRAVDLTLDAVALWV